jgi:hypothetical protein
MAFLPQLSSLPESNVIPVQKKMPTQATPNQKFMELDEVGSYVNSSITLDIIQSPLT